MQPKSLIECPFCGFEQGPNVMLTGGKKLKTQICYKCGASGPTVLADDQSLAVFERWNQRHMRTCTLSLQWEYDGNYLLLCSECGSVVVDGEEPWDSSEDDMNRLAGVFCGGCGAKITKDEEST